MYVVAVVRRNHSPTPRTAQLNVPVVSQECVCVCVLNLFILQLPNAARGGVGSGGTIKMRIMSQLNSFLRSSAVSVVVPLDNSIGTIFVNAGIV